MKNKKKIDMLDRQNRKRYFILLGITLAFLVLFSFTIPYFISIYSIINLIRESTVLAIMAIGMTAVILTGGIDLSVGSNIAITGVMTALAINATGATTHASAYVGFITAILFGTLFGCMNGILVGYLKISAFMATLATMSIGSGLALLITNSSPIVVDNNTFNYFGNGELFFTGSKIPSMLILLVPIIIISAFLLKYSMFGRKTYAIGGNPVASRATGINVRFQTLCVYGFMGLMCGVGTIITIGNSSSAQPLAALGTEFDVITAVVVGGISLTGGVGTLTGALLGALLLGVLYLGLDMINIQIYISYIMKGIFVLGAVLANQVSVSYSNRIQTKVVKNTPERQKIKNAVLGVKYSQGEHSVLTLKNISKYFPGVHALNDVTFEIKKGTVHALVGENGSGKSTLMKVLSGVYQKDAGEILVDGVPVKFRSPQDSQKMGIAVIYQEFALVPELSISQNVFMGKEMTNKSGLLSINKMRKQTRQLLQKFGLNVDTGMKVNSLTVGKQQLIEIAKAFGSSAWIVVMDEPTSAISEADRKELFNIIRDLKKQGVAIVYISHKIQEIFEIADEITVLRDGRHVITAQASELNEEKLIKYMVDREFNDIFYRLKQKSDTEVLKVENLSLKNKFKNISFTVNAGEVVGMAGLIGAGRTEVARCIFGLDKADSGAVYLDGKKMNIKSTKEAMQNDICYVSEDRRREGIIPMMSIKENILIAIWEKLSWLGFIDFNKGKQISDSYIQKFAIKTPSDLQLISNLSGGNQQKCCLARMLALNPKVIILDEPTRGIDVGAKAEIHKLIDGLAKNGMAVILISSELPEIIGACDKIVVMAEGALTALIDNTVGMTQEEIMSFATL